MSSSDRQTEARSLTAQLWRVSRFLGLTALGRAVAWHWPLPVRARLLNSRWMYVDLRSGIGRSVFATGKFDIEAIKPALALMSPGATYVDVGANIGVYAMMALDVVGPTGRIHCFEIDPRPLSVLKKSVKAFNIGNIEVHECAVSDCDGTTTFLPASESGHNRINQSGGRARVVRSVRLDTWARGRSLDRLDVIKIDVEGAEKLVLEGARQTIAKFKPLILCEASEQNTVHFGYRPVDLISLLRTLDYETDWLEGVDTPTLVARHQSLLR